MNLCIYHRTFHFLSRIAPGTLSLYKQAKAITTIGDLLFSNLASVIFVERVEDLK